jgi:hypothetical protein
VPLTFLPTSDGPAPHDVRVSVARMIREHLRGIVSAMAL